MDNCSKNRNSCTYGDKSSEVEWEFINMNEQEEDIICRMHKLVGDKWELIAGRIPGRAAKEIERFWMLRNDKDGFKAMRIESIDHQIRRRS